MVYTTEQAKEKSFKKIKRQKQLPRNICHWNAVCLVFCTLALTNYHVSKAITLNHTVRSKVLSNKTGYRCRDYLRPRQVVAKLSLEKVFKSHEVVLHVLACASCINTNVSVHRLLVVRVVFPMLSHQVGFHISHATAVLNSCSADLTYGQTFVQMSLLIKPKCLPNIIFQLMHCKQRRSVRTCCFCCCSCGFSLEYVNTALARISHRSLAFYESWEMLCRIGSKAWVNWHITLESGHQPLMVNLNRYRGPRVKTGYRFLLVNLYTCSNYHSALSGVCLWGGPISDCRVWNSSPECFQSISWVRLYWMLSKNQQNAPWCRFSSCQAVYVLSLSLSLTPLILNDSWRWYIKSLLQYTAEYYVLYDAAEWKVSNIILLHAFASTTLITFILQCQQLCFGNITLSVSHSLPSLLLLIYFQPQASNQSLLD